MHTSDTASTRTTAIPRPPREFLAGTAAAVAGWRSARRGVRPHDVPIRVLLVDDRPILRAGLRALLRTVPDLDVVGEAADGLAALVTARRLSPDVVLMDRAIAGGDGTAAMRAITALSSPPRVLVLTMQPEEEGLVPLLEAGASGYLARDAADRELVDAIRAVAAGEVYLRPALGRARRLTTRDAPPMPRPLHAQYAALSEREKLVVALVAEGYNGPEIGQRLGISAKTVDTYKQRVEDKLGLAHRRDYVRFALALGLLAAPDPSVP
ncbi:MAG TPA: response regulator transcription factor [Gemmatimonadaceae bacterium]|nr:response regulator transcription factor [Gemmatimonadaceae bacterium]